MTYIKVRWIHSDPDYPVLLYSELDERRWEIHKVETYPDGHYGYASAEALNDLSQSKMDSFFS